MATAGVRRYGPVLLLPVLALLLVSPLLLRGPSCGHDFGFHMQSWMDAASQMRHGDLLPPWAFSPAFNAGEPRFVFYPPLSWVLGAGLLQVLPAAVVPASFTLIALTLAGWGMWALARRYTSPAGALLAASLYLASPYMLFTAFERTAFAELLAAAWIPWLLRAALAEEPSIPGIAVPLALLWLTNAPAAVMGSYAFGFLVLVRLMQRTKGQLQAQTGTRGLDIRLASRAVAGFALGLALAGFYLLPAAWERRYVQITMAIIPNMRVEDNFLFGHTGYGPHDAVLHTASMVAVSLMALSGVALLAAWWRTSPSAKAQGNEARGRRSTLWALILLAALLGVLVEPSSLRLWRLLPELLFLQFPWRWMSVLGCVFAVGAALALGSLRFPMRWAVLLSLCLAGGAGHFALGPFREGCEAHELPGERVALFAAHHGVGPTDEYTPGDSDNDQLRWDNPAWWLADDVNAPGPGTVPNPAATIVNYDEPPPLDQTVSGRAPRRLQVKLARPQILVLNLRDYPAWVVQVNGAIPAHMEREDGLLAVPLPAGADDVEVHWRRLPDVWLGDALTLVAVGVVTFLALRSRRIRVYE